MGGVAGVRVKVTRRHLLGTLQRVIKGYKGFATVVNF